ncbi:MAG: amidohydrolase family protein [Firmicutes bacterium]|nr:amidohydrolase family protein [Bacillota bacterium]
MNLIVRNCKLKGQPGLKDIGVTGEKIVAVEDHIQAAASQEIDARGRLTTPAFIDPHIHLDKTLIADVARPNLSGALQEAIEIIWEKKARYTVEEIVERAGKTIRMAAQNGTTRMRTHVDVDNIGGLTPLKGLLAARERHRDIMDIEIVAFPQEGILKNPGCEDLMREAMETGADVVGGMPANENTPEDSRRHIEICFEIAGRFNADIDMHVDETDDPFYRTLEMLADQTIANGWEGRVTAGHTCALAAYDDHYAGYVIEKVKRAGIHMITNPATNLMLQGRLDPQPRRRGITRVKELLEAGVNVSFGQDCVRDTFYPFGQADMLEVALITAHAAHLSLPREIDQVFEMMTVHAARLLRLGDYGLEPGCRADIVVLDAGEAGDAIRFRPDRLYVLHRGRVIAENKTSRKLRRELPHQ